jgi:hypothetical protein
MSSTEMIISPEEAVMLGAADGLFFGRYFFPHLFRQQSPAFHRDLWNLFTLNRFSSAMIFRGGAKTTIMRLNFAHRISYGLLRTGLFLGKSEGHAAEHVIWLEREIEYNTLWAGTFGLTRGNLWNQTECEIIHNVDKYPLRLQAMGMFGSVRGINIHGHRPDTIGVDDPLDEENSATPEQRKKGTELFFGAVKESLVPESEDPTARLMLTQTPFDEDDLSYVCHKSSQIASIRIGILTSEDDDSAESAWPDRWSKKEILADKLAAVERNQLSLWLREKMCLIVSRETADFRPEWLQYYTIVPPGAIYVGAIDPAPILSDKARLTGAQTDLQAIMVCAYWRGHKYVVEYATARDQDPEAVARELHRLATKYPIRGWGVEGVAYQRTLKWYLEREMQAGRLRHLRIVEVPAPKGKHERIVQAHSGRASSRCLWVKKEHVEFIEAFTKFPNIRYKDLLDVSAQCDMVISPRQEHAIDGEFSVIDEKGIPALTYERGAP